MRHNNGIQALLSDKGPLGFDDAVSFFLLIPLSFKEHFVCILTFFARKIEMHLGEKIVLFFSLNDVLFGMKERKDMYRNVQVAKEL